MSQINVTWVQDRTFIGTDSTNHSAVISSTKDGIGMKPSELLLVSLGSCTGYDVVDILMKKRAKVTGLHITVDGEQAGQPPYVFTKIHIHYAVTGFSIKSNDVEKAIKLSKEKYCSVSLTLEPSVEITYDFEVIEAES